MTASPASTSEMDQLDQLGAKAFDGFLVRKDLVLYLANRRALLMNLVAPVLIGSSQFDRRVALVPPPVHDMKNRPYQSGAVGLEQNDPPPCNWPGPVRTAYSKSTTS